MWSASSRAGRAGLRKQQWGGAWGGIAGQLRGAQSTRLMPKAAPIHTGGLLPRVSGRAPHCGRARVRDNCWLHWSAANERVASLSLQTCNGGCCQTRATVERARNPVHQLSDPVAVKNFLRHHVASFGTPTLAPAPPRLLRHADACSGTPTLAPARWSRGAQQRCVRQPHRSSLERVMWIFEELSRFEIRPLMVRSNSARALLKNSASG